MSNVKRIKIEGDVNTLLLQSAPLPGVKVTFVEDGEWIVEDLVKGHNIEKNKVGEVLEAVQVVNKFLAISTLPTFGLKVRFTGASRNEKNGYNGMVVYHRYIIEGEEAIAWAWYDKLIDSLNLIGNVGDRSCKDLEA